jgi:hypothetical protein
MRPTCDGARACAFSKTSAAMVMMTAIMLSRSRPAQVSYSWLSAICDGPATLKDASDACGPGVFYIASPCVDEAGPRVGLECRPGQDSPF